MWPLVDGYKPSNDSSPPVSDEVVSELLDVLPLTVGIVLEPVVEVLLPTGLVLVPVVAFWVVPEDPLDPVDVPPSRPKVPPSKPPTTSVAKPTIA